MDYVDRVSGLKLVADGEKVTNQLRAQKCKRPAFLQASESCGAPGRI